MIKMHAERRKKWLTKRSIFNCFLISLAILILALFFEIGRIVVTSKLPIIERTLFFVILWATLAGIIWLLGFVSPDVTEVALKMLGFEEEEQKKDESQKTSHSGRGKKEKEILDFSVGSKLALLIFGLFAIASFFIILIGIYLYLNIEVESSFLITVFSGILLGSFATTTVIWRTLRESLHKKKEHLHETLVLPRLYRMITGPLFTRLDPEAIKKNRDDVRRYGKFLGIISLYSGKALEKTDEFISALKDFHGNLKEICDLTGIKMEQKTRMENLLYRYGLRPLTYSALGGEAEERKKVMAQKLHVEHTELVNDTREKWAKLKEIGKQIRNELEDFFRRSNLPFEYV